MYKNIKKNEVEIIAIGKFDGVHRGHKELFKKLGPKGALFVIKKGKNTLTPNDKREEYINHKCFKYDFLEIKNFTGIEFINFLKKEFVLLKKIIVGYDFRFGLDRAWGIEELKNIFDGEIVVIPEFSLNGVQIHASVIKDNLLNGNIKHANALLGREYSFEGAIVSGYGIGQKSLFPTINIEVSDFFIPKNGVYATRTQIRENSYDSVSFIGNKVSIDGSFSIETHLLNFESTVKNGENIEIYFVDFIRENRKFDYLEDLKKQIIEDIKIAEKVLKSCEVSTTKINEATREK